MAFSRSSPAIYSVYWETSQGQKLKRLKQEKDQDTEGQIDPARKKIKSMWKIWVTKPVLNWPETPGWSHCSVMELLCRNMEASRMGEGKNDG